MHRDIKPENYLVCLSKKQAFTIKLGDLGFASAVTKSKSFYQSKKGTDAYFAPEVEKGQSRIQSDLYSLGIVLLELDNLDKLNENWVDSATKTEIYEGKTIASKYQINRTSNIYKIAKTCLKPQYLERTTAGDLLSELIQLHGKPLQFILTSMILEDQIPQQAQHILNGIKQSQKNMQTKFEEEAKLLLDNTDTKIKIKDNEQKFTKVEILSKLLKSLYEVKKYSNNFQILSFGSYGMVLATKKIQFNYKEIVLKIQRIDDEKQIQNEIRIMNQLKTPLVVQLYDSYVIEKATAPERYIVFELEKCSCSLEEYLERQAIDTELSDEEKLTIARQIIDSVNYIHWFNIIHRDIKADNFLVCLDGNQPEIKLCDFGLSAQLQNNLESIETLDMIGNKAYMAPEIITKNDNENKIYSKKSQIEQQVEHMIQFYGQQIQEEFKFNRDNLIKLISQLFNNEQYNRSFQIIGFGTYWIILATWNKKIQKDIVLKVQEIQNEEQIKNQIHIMRMAQMPLITEFYSHYYLQGLNTRYVVYELERCTCSLLNYLDKQKKEKEISENQKMLISCQIISAVNFLHSLDIIHNDLKPDNFQILEKDNQIQVKLSDFGCAIKLDKQDFIETEANLGTFIFWAPETYHDINNKRIYSKKVLIKFNKFLLAIFYKIKSDIFSVGLVLCLVDNYLAFSQDQNKYPQSYYNMIKSQFTIPFDPQTENDRQDKLNRKTKIYEFIKDFLVHQQVNRKDLLYHIEQNPENFLVISKPMLEILKIAGIQNQSITDLITIDLDFSKLQFLRIKK
ncbi:hypothetical protein ABPG74_019192 [Tetrahymena malaccensis]